MKKILSYFTVFEWLLWSVSCVAATVLFCVFDRSNYFSLVASLIGITSLIFIAKGNPIGQILTIIFSGLYGYVSFTFAYYGEMITYLGMTAPMATVAFVSWIRHPSASGKAEVKVNVIKIKEIVFMLFLTAGVTAAFYFILSALHTANIVPSTLSVATSFLAGYLIFRRSAYYALAYAVNDIVLIVLWSLALTEDISYISTLVCFVAFFANDIYGFINWQRMKKRQSAE